MTHAPADAGLTPRQCAALDAVYPPALWRRVPHAERDLEIDARQWQANVLEAYRAQP